MINEDSQVRYKRPGRPEQDTWKQCLQLMAEHNRINHKFVKDIVLYKISQLGKKGVRDVSGC